MTQADVDLFDASWVKALAYEAGEIGLRHFRQTTASRKADNTLVTIADGEIETFLKQCIGSRHPDDGILGEEDGQHQGRSGRHWVLDPIDGTAVFAAGLPNWCVSIGLMAAGQPIAGLVYLPVTGDCFIADTHGPATLNDEPINVAPRSPYTRDTMLFGVADAHRAWEVDFPGKVRAFGSCAAHICYVAQGSGVAAFNAKTALWDVAGALPILERAGGQMIQHDGSPFAAADYLDGSKFRQPIIAAAPHYVEDIRNRIRPKG
jgi:myo-inositol-1(or 4)-monophosphatase